jgi:ABC-type nitrate/sulfonate/bicarbonate transport system substrate-binding protein
VLLTNLEERIARKGDLLGGARMLVDISSVIRAPNNGLAVSEAMLADKPDVVERMVRGTLMAVRYIKTQPEGALAVFAKHAKGVAPDVLGGALDEQAAKFLDNGEASLDAWKAELAVRASIVGLKEPPPPQSVFDYTLVKKAAQKLAASGWQAEK